MTTATGNSVLDETGYVVLYSHPDGSRHLFRDNNPDGLLLHSHEGGWALTRETHTRTEAEGVESWAMVPDAEPICAVGRDGRDYVARHLPSRRVLRRHDTQYGLLAKVARYYLRPAVDAAEAEDGEG